MNAPQTLSYAQAAALALSEAMTADARIVALGEDLGRGGVFGQYRGLQQAFGAERVIDTPISEAGIMGAAVGMALAGLKPVVEMRVIDFALCAIDEIVNQAAKNRFMFGGQGRVPLVARMPIGIWGASAAQHSQSLEAWFAHMPGLLVVTPSTPQDNYSLLKAALASGDPVVYLEHKELWGEAGEVHPLQPVPLGRARVARSGGDLTIVSWSKAVQWSLAAAESLAAEGVQAEVIDLRTLKPWDEATVLASVARTGRCVVVDESYPICGGASEWAACISEHAFHHLKAPVQRVSSAHVPIPFSPVLEKMVIPQPADIIAAVQRIAAPAMEARK